MKSTYNIKLKPNTITLSHGFNSAPENKAKAIENYLKEKQFQNDFQLIAPYPPEQLRIVSPLNHTDFCWQILCSMSLQEKMFSEDCLMECWIFRFELCHPFRCDRATHFGLNCAR
jgi:hypothetical protein